MRGAFTKVLTQAEAEDLLTTGEAAQLLEPAGFRMLEDSGAEEWRKLYSTNPNRKADAYRERIALAERSE